MKSESYNFAALNYSGKWVPGGPGREPVISRMSQREAVRMAILDGKNSKDAAAATGVCSHVISVIASNLGFRRLYVTEAERAAIMQMRAAADQAQKQGAA